MESMALGAAFSSLALVWSAYSRVKSNKERCAQLAARCELIFDRLHAMVMQQQQQQQSPGRSSASTSASSSSGPSSHVVNAHAALVDERIRQRVRELELTFRRTADTIARVGGQNYLVSVLRSEENAAAIEDMQRALTELVSLMTLETIIDVSAWQREAERARERDCRALLARCSALEQGQAAVSEELARSGASAEELRRGMQALTALVGSSHSRASALPDSTPVSPVIPPPSPASSIASFVSVRGTRAESPLPPLPRHLAVDAREDADDGATLRPRSWSTPVSERPTRETLLADVSPASPAHASPTVRSGSGRTVDRAQRAAIAERRGALGRLRIPALTQRNLAEPSSAVDYVASVHAPSIRSQTESRNANATSIPPYFNSTSPVTPVSTASSVSSMSDFWDGATPRPFALGLRETLTPEAAAAFGAPAPEDPITPPPPYQLVQDEIAAAAAKRAQARERSNNSRASTEGLYRFTLDQNALMPEESPRTHDTSTRARRSELERGRSQRRGRSPSPRPVLQRNFGGSPASGTRSSGVNAVDGALARVKEALKQKEVDSFRLLKTTGAFGQQNRRVVLELYERPSSSKSNDTKPAMVSIGPIPLEHFAPTARDVLAFRTRGAGDAEINSTFGANAGVGSVPEGGYNEVILLCPRGHRPVCVLTRSGRTRTQPSLKTYVLDTLDPQTLVSVKDGVGTTSWYLIPYHPAMYIEEVKKLIQEYYARNHFSQVIVTNCNLVNKKTELRDKSTFSDIGVKPYDHHIKLKISF